MTLYNSKTEFFISKNVGKAVFDYKMIEDNDRVAVGVSGGKDSLGLLNILRKRQRFVPIKYEIIALHVSDDPENAAVLEKYFKKNGFNYKMVEVKEEIKVKKKKSPCFFCSWKRREYLFKAAKKMDCRKIAMAHHKDDIAQTMLLNLFFNGEISTMLPKQEFFKGELYIIRPLAYVEEKLMARYAKEMKFFELPNACPYALNSNRKLMKDILNRVEKECKDVKTNVFRSLQRIKKEYLP